MSDRATYRARLAPSAAQDGATAPRTLRPDARRERTRSRLIAAAMRVAALDGPTGVSVAAIAEEAGVTTGTFYNYFDSKDAALDAGLRADTQRFFAEIAAATADLDPPHTLATAIRTLTRRFADEPHLRGLAVAASLADRTRRQRLIALFRVMFRRGAELGFYDPGAVELAPYTVGGALSATIGAWNNGALLADPGRELATEVLCLLGLPRAEAARIADESPPSNSDPVLPAEQQ